LSQACDRALRELERLKSSTKAVRFEGLRTFGERELLRELRENVGRLGDDESPVTPEVIEKAKAVILDYLASRGHLHATITAEFDEATKAATFVIDEGKQTRIAEIGFDGNEVFPTEQLRQQFTECLTSHEDSGYNAEIFDYCLRGLNNFVRSKGYLQARLGDAKFKEGKDGLLFTINVDEGLLYRLAKVSISGSRFLTPDQIRTVIGLKEGDIANGELIGKALYQDLKNYYGNHGFIQYTSELTPTFKANPKKVNEGIVDFELTIDEGKQFKIHSIKFEGVDLPEKLLRDLFVIREGDVFNQQTFEQSIEKLNDTGLFTAIDKDGDVDYRTNEAQGQLSLTIRVSPERRAREPNAATLKARLPESPK
jgi:outer membrane protein insertion porin family